MTMASDYAARESFGIGDLAAAAGLKPTTIRYYESLGLVIPTARAAGQRRFNHNRWMLL